MARDDRTSRRRVLLGTGVAIGTAGLAGCGIPGGEDDEEGDDDGGGDEGEGDEDGEDEEGDD